MIVEYYRPPDLKTFDESPTVEHRNGRGDGGGVDDAGLRWPASKIQLRRMEIMRSRISRVVEGHAATMAAIKDGDGADLSAKR